MPETTPRTGLLLINLGTPTAPEAGPVRTYLRQFLADPRVLDIPALGRWALLHLFILPFRPAKSAAAYRKVWSDRGSPLLYHSQDLLEAVQSHFAGRLKVVLAMRYGQPSIARGLTELRDAGCERVIVLPLYPQYASSSTGSSLEEVYRVAGRLWNVPHLQVVEPFYDHPGFIDAFVAQARPVIDEVQPDKVLFSFHGLPERQVQKSDPTGRHCLADAACCDTIDAANRFCYRAQCVQTAKALMGQLALTADQSVICFQSRLGRTPWVKPYTDVVLQELAQAGAKRLVVICPAFTADCLETLEEIGIRADEDFRALGGETLRLVPSLNATPAWVAAIADMVRPHLGEAMA